MILPETHVGELFDTALADLVQAVRAPDHPDAGELVRRAHLECGNGFADIDDGVDDVAQAWSEGAAEGVFLALLAVASLLVEKGVEVP